MDVHVNRHVIRSERERRAWSQEHLATIADLGVRTIQRIEASGLASYESAKAIAVAFGMGVTDLVPEPTSGIASFSTLRSRVSKAALATAASVVIGASLLLGKAALAKDVMLKVGLMLNNEQRTMRLLTADGKDAEIRVAGLFRLVVVPTIRPDGRVHLAAQIYAPDRDGFVLVSEPSVVTEDDTEAEIIVSSDQGDSFKVLITPDVQ